MVEQVAINSVTIVVTPPAIPPGLSIMDYIYIAIGCVAGAGILLGGVLYRKKRKTQFKQTDHSNFKFEVDLDNNQTFIKNRGAGGSGKSLPNTTKGFDGWNN